MASRVFPNTVYVKGFPATTSRALLLRIFGGGKGHIKDLQFTNAPGEPKKAFIEYSYEDSVPEALRMNGNRIHDHSEVLQVRKVDEAILCKHIPGELYDEWDALKNLQKVLEHVLYDKNSEQHTHISKVRQQETERAAQAQTIEKLKRAVTIFKEQKEKVEQDLSAQLADARVQLETSETNRSQARISLTETEARLGAAQELLQSQEGEMKTLRRRLQEACDQKESTMERLGIANNKATTLEEELKMIKDERFEALTTLRRTQKSLDQMDIQLRAAEGSANMAEKKRKRVEEWLDDEREAKRHVVIQSRELEERYKTMAQQVESGYLEKLDSVKTRLMMEVAERREVEGQLAQANAKLDKTIITDSLLAAFIKMDNWTIQLLGEEQ